MELRFIEIAYNRTRVRVRVRVRVRYVIMKLRFIEIA